jgi:hypothetical protein
MERPTRPKCRKSVQRITSALAPLGTTALLLASCGCSALQSAQAPGGAYVAADRATFEALAPEYAAYVAADPALPDEDRARRTRTLQTWRMRIEAAEQAAAAPSSQPATSGGAR